MPSLPPLRLLRPASPAAFLAAALAALAAAPAPGQETPAPARDPRPQAHAYTVLDGRSAPRPLGGATGDAARGREIYADPALGGCQACHAAPGLPRGAFVPAALAQRAPEPEPEPALPPALDDPEAGALDEEGEPGSDSDSRLAPDVAALPPARPEPEAEGTEADAASVEPAGDGSGALDVAAAALLPLPQGPDLAGVASRLEVGELRLLVINPRIARAESRMPAYHTISLAQAALTPALRQPWLSAQEVEDVVAYLATLDGREEPAEESEDSAAPEDEAAPAGDAAGAETDAGDGEAAPAPAAPEAQPSPAGEAPPSGEAGEAAPPSPDPAASEGAQDPAAEADASSNDEAPAAAPDAETSAAAPEADASSADEAPAAAPAAETPDAAPEADAAPGAEDPAAEASDAESEVPPAAGAPDGVREAPPAVAIPEAPAPEEPGDAPVDTAN